MLTFSSLSNFFSFIYMMEFDLIMVTIVALALRYKLR